MSLELAQPRALFLVWLVPALTALFWLGGHVRGRGLERLLGTPEPGRERLYRNWPLGPLMRGLLATVALLLMVLALSRPVWGYRIRRTERLSANVVIALDTSRSMLVPDATGGRSRLEFASLKISMLLDALKGDRVGLVAFAGEGITACPLTYDTTAPKAFLRALEPGTVPLGGTSLAQALGAALRMLGRGPEGGKVVVLVTDGEDHDTEALNELVSKAAKGGISIHTLGVGTTRGAPIRIEKADGSWEYVKNSQGAIVQSRLNEDLLARTASQAHGVYARAAPGNEDVNAIAQAVGRAGRSEGGELLQKVPVERYRWPATGALLALIALLFLPKGTAVS